MIKELLKTSLEYKPKKTIIILIQILLSFFTLNMAFSLFDSSEKEIKHMNHVTQTLHKINDNFFGEEEQKFFSRYDNVDILKKLFIWEDQNESFDYIVMNKQNISTEYIDLPFNFQVGHNFGEETPNLYRSIQANSRFFKYYNIELSKGDYFQEADYILDNDIPVLLGDSYNEYLDLNEGFEISYLGKSLNCYVKGFISKESYINNGYNIEYLNDIMVLPSLNIDEIDDRYFALKLYLDKCSGYIYAKQDINLLQRNLTSKCIELDISPYTIEGLNSFYLSMWGLEGKQLKNIFLGMLVLVFVTSIICISINESIKISKLKKYYSIYIMNGIPRKNVTFSIVLEILLLNCIAMLVATIICSLLLFPVNYLIISISTLISTVISSIYPLICFKTINLSTAIRGKE